MKNIFANDIILIKELIFVKYCPLCKTPFPDNWEECDVCESVLISEKEFEKYKLQKYKEEIQKEYNRAGKISYNFV